MVTWVSTNATTMYPHHGRGMSPEASSESVSKLVKGYPGESATLEVLARLRLTHDFTPFCSPRLHPCCLLHQALSSILGPRGRRREAILQRNRAAGGRCVPGGWDRESRSGALGRPSICRY